MLPNSINSDFTEFLTNDVSTKIVTKYSKPSDWQNIAAVSKKWLSLVPKSFVQLSSILKALKTIPFSIQHDTCEKYQTMRDIVKILAPWNLVEAENYASQMPEIFLDMPNCHKAAAFKALIKIDAKQDLEQAKARALSLENDWHKDRAFLHIARQEARVDLEGAKQTAELIDYAATKALAYMEIAQFDHAYLPKAIENACKYDIVEIVKAQAKVNLKDAKKTAMSIKKSKLRLKSLLEIAKLDPQCNLEELRKYILTTADLKPQTKIKLLINVTALSPDTNFLAQLNQIASTIKNLCDKAWSLMDIAECNPEHDFSEAKAVAMIIPEAPVKNRALSLIAIKEAAYDFAKALETLEMIDDQEEIDDAYIGLARILARQNQHDEALALVSQIQDLECKAHAFASVGSLNPQDSLENAQKLSLQIQDPIAKARLLLEAAKIFSKRAKQIV